MEIKHAAHRTYRIRYHMVFVVKNRKKMLLEKTRIEFMSTIKSWSARLIFKKYPYIKKELWGGEFWSDGGHIDTVSEYGGLERIKKYVREQGRDVSQLKLAAFT